MSSATNAAQKAMVVGYACNEKKQAKFFDQLLRTAETEFPGCFEWIRLPLRQHAGEVDADADTASVDVVLHKRTDDMVASLRGDRAARHRVRNLERWARRRTRHGAVDPMESVWAVVDRVRLYERLDTVTSLPRWRTYNFCRERRSPRDLARAAAEEVGLPLVLKRRVACGTPDSHKMALVKTIDGLERVISDIAKHPAPSDIDEDWVAQRYIPHGEHIAKVYVVGEDHVVVQMRASSVTAALVHASADPAWFDSQTKVGDGSVAASESLLASAQALAKTVSRALNLTLLGVDFVAEEKSDKRFVLDVNYLPSFTGVDSAYRQVCQHLLSTCEWPR